jgi:hypothetical protein
MASEVKPRSSDGNGFFPSTRCPRTRWTPSRQRHRKDSSVVSRPSGTKQPIQYFVPVDRALDVLERASSKAAVCWRENAPRLIGRGRYFGFAAEVCEEVADQGEADDRDVT